MLIKFDCSDSVWDNDILYPCDPLGEIRGRDRDDEYEDDDLNWIDEYYNAHRDEHDL